MSASQTTLELLTQQFGSAVWLTLKQVALVIGLAEQTIHNQLCEGRCTLPVCKIGRRLKVHVIDLADWIDAQRGPCGSAPQGGAPRGAAPQERSAAAGGASNGPRRARSMAGAG